jgi:hypothetical protein
LNLAGTLGSAIHCCGGVCLAHCLLPFGSMGIN